MDARVRGRLPNDLAMPLDTMLRMFREEAAAEQLRANALAGTVTALLGAGRDSSAAEQELFGVLDRLALLRKREHTIEVMRAYAFTDAAA